MIPLLARLLPLLIGGEGALGGGLLRGLLGKGLPAATGAAEGEAATSSGIGDVVETLINHSQRGKNKNKPSPVPNPQIPRPPVPQPAPSGGGGGGPNPPGPGPAPVPPAPPNPPQPPRPPLPPNPPPLPPGPPAPNPPAPVPAGQGVNFGKLLRDLLQVTKKLIASFLTLYGAVTGAATAWYGVVRSAEFFAKTISESRRELGLWNGQIAMSFAKLDFARMQRQIQMGRGTEGTTAALNQTIDDLERMFLPLKTSLANLTNIGGIIVAKFAQANLYLSKIFGIEAILRGIAEKFGILAGADKKGGGDPLRGFLDAFIEGARPAPGVPPLGRDKMPAAPLPEKRAPPNPLPPVR